MYKYPLVLTPKEYMANATLNIEFRVQLVSHWRMALAKFFICLGATFLHIHKIHFTRGPINDTQERDGCCRNQGYAPDEPETVEYDPESSEWASRSNIA